MIHNGLSLDQVLHLHHLGINVIPEGSSPKVPRYPWKHWQTERQSEEQVSLWYNRHGADNWLLITGKVSGIVAIDADDAEAVAWVEKNLPATPVTTTTSRGKHYIYRHPMGETITNATGLNGLKLDRRGDGGILVAPGSSKRSTGHVYQWGEPWTVDLLATAETYSASWFPDEKKRERDNVYTGKQHEEAIRDSSLPTMKTREKAARAYLDRIHACKKGDGGKYCLAVASCLLWEHCLSAELATDLLYDWGLKTTRDGLPEPWKWGEITHKIDDALKGCKEEDIGSRVRHLHDDDSRLDEIIKGVDLPPAAPTALAPAEQPVTSSDWCKANIWRWSEMRKVALEEKETWIINELLERGGLNILSALSYGGKTTLMGRLIANIVEGQDFFGFGTVPTPILYFNCDAARIRRLYHNIAKHLITTNAEERCEHFFTAHQTERIPDLLSPAYIRTAITHAKEALGWKAEPLVIIDTFRSAFVSANPKMELGGEIDSIVMSKILKPVQEVARSTGGTILVLHHNAQGTNRYAGAGSIPNLTDSMWNYIRQEKTNLAELAIETRDKQHLLQIQYDGTLELTGNHKLDVLTAFGDGKTIQEVADLTKNTSDWVHDLASRYKDLPENTYPRLKQVSPHRGRIAAKYSFVTKGEGEK